MVSNSKHAYPSIDVSSMEEDDVSHERNLRLLTKEAAKPKMSQDCPHLIARTFKKRREWILNEPHPVHEIIERYSFLKKSLYVSTIYVFFIYVVYCMIQYIVGCE